MQVCTKIMRLQPCSALHYISAIKGGSISKVLNVNSRRKPALVFRSLTDIYEDGFLKNVHGPLEVALQDGCGNEEVENIIENLCLPKAERITNQSDQDFSVSDCNDNEIEIVSGLDDISFGEMTLKELRKTCKSKKRKMSDSICLMPDFQQDEDDCDLTTPLSSWNTKPSKRAKSVNEHVKRSASAIPEHDTTDQILDPPSSQQSSNASCAPMAIKAEISPVCCFEPQIVSFADEATDDSSISDEQVKLFDMDSSKLLQTSDTVLENKETVSLSGQYETCANTSSPSQVNDDFMPLSVLPPPSVKTAGLSTQDTFQNSSVSRVTELHKESDILQSPSTESFPLIDKHIFDRSLVIHGIGDEVSEVPLCNGTPSTKIVNGSELCVFEDDARNRLNIFGASQSLNMPDTLSNESEYIVSNVATNDSLHIESGRGVTLSVFEDALKTNLSHYQPIGSLRRPFSYYSSPWNFYPCSASDSDLVADESDSPTNEDDWSLISYNSNTSGYCLEPDTQLTDLEDASYANEKQLLLPINTDVEISFSSNADDELSIPETNNHGDMVLWQPPERFPSTRKVISPTFQEKVCLTMNYRELTEGIENHSKGKLFPGNQSEDNALSDTSGVESCVTSELTEMGNQKKENLAPKKILKKPKHNKKGALPKRCNSPIGRVGCPPLTRFLPDICNGRTSTEACQERAIAFSQRQMQDIESIAVKLMTELKSMKNIVEEKLFHEAYRCTSMKNDADEVKSAIKSATRVEETTKKWLSMMARDCNRFCKIMSQPQRSTVDASAVTETIMHREKKKISFADEAGGVLCHVKYFENGETNTNVAS